ncbi:LysR family transcriptional regulator [Bermanella marisrubri]|uniref:Probable transcription regulator protein n=1 Tax=Bermanella marisrubri TaxID=207949 RepID=Q1N2P7_9GAMM|nr:LysR family transcriptional regulator [Bermanella marisrubri]EAT12622.1 probable transcription regulator protein [Oceanobacter sp. RED65] [Bermanella marisrubri]QIZ84827.1 LysR family transcriptional regulator [Bermanella marisrubri]
MLDLNQMSVFIAVVKEGSFTGAARQLGIPKSRVSRMITDLEDKLNARLLERTTREVRPTDIGLEYYQEYKPLFEEISDIHSRISDRSQKPSGHLRICAPVSFAFSAMGRWMAEFKSHYPEVEVELVFSDGDVHLVRDGFDIGFAIGELEDSSLIARKFDETSPVLCASPDFVKRYGPFNHPEQLREVPWVIIGSRHGHRHNTEFTHPETGETVEIEPDCSVMVNHQEVAIHHLTASQGLSVTAAFFAYEQLLRGELQILLANWKIKQEPLQLVFPSGRHQAKKVRAFIDFFMEKTNKMHALMEKCAHLSQEQQAKQLREYLEQEAL